jgi:hypothetical protein
MSLFNASLPNDRRWARVGDFYEITRKPRGLDLSGVIAVPFATMDSIPQGGGFAPRYMDKPPSSITSGTYFERGDILIAKITPSFENGKQALAENLPSEFGYATTEVIPLRPTNVCHDRRLLFFYLLHPDIRSFLAEKMEGATGRQRVPERVLLDLPFPEIAAEEQTVIADALHLVRRAIEVERKLSDNCAELNRAAMRELFTRGLRGEAQKDTEIGLVPESWALTPAEQIFKLTSGKTRPDQINPVPTADQPCPVLGGNGVMGYSSKWNLDKDKILVIGRVGEYCGAVHVASGKVWITDNALYAQEWLNPAADIRYVAAFLQYYTLIDSNGWPGSLWSRRG